MKHALALGSAMLCGLVLSCGQKPLHSELSGYFAGAASPEMLTRIQQSETPIPLADILQSPAASEMSPEALTSARSLVALGWAATMPATGQHDAISSEAVVWVILPQGNEEDIKELVGYDRNGTRHVLSAEHAPQVPVVVIGPDESKFAPESVALKTTDAGQMDAVPTGKIDMISFKNVKEPWFKGNAEIYALVTYISKAGKGASEIVPLLGVHKKDTNYNVNKLIHYWNNNSYAIVDVAFFEHDSNYDYTALTKICLDAVAKIVTVFQPGAGMIVQIVTSVLSAAISALPSGTLVDKDDFLDVMNTVTRGHSAVNALGVSGNMTVSISPFELEEAL